MNAASISAQFSQKSGKKGMNVTIIPFSFFYSRIFFNVATIHTVIQSNAQCYICRVNQDILFLALPPLRPILYKYRSKYKAYSLKLSTRFLHPSRHGIGESSATNGIIVTPLSALVRPASSIYASSTEKRVRIPICRTIRLTNSTRDDGIRP